MERIKQRAWEAALAQVAIDYNARPEDFLREGWIRELPAQGRKRRYRLTPAGAARLRQEAERLRRLCGDFDAVMGQSEEKTP